MTLPDLFCLNLDTVLGKTIAIFNLTRLRLTVLKPFVTEESRVMAFPIEYFLDYTGSDTVRRSSRF